MGHTQNGILSSQAPQAENVPAPKHMYSIEVNCIAYLEQFATFWLSQTCILNMSNIHF